MVTSWIGITETTRMTVVVVELEREKHTGYCQVYTIAMVVAHGKSFSNIGTTCRDR